MFLHIQYLINGVFGSTIKLSIILANFKGEKFFQQVKFHTLQFGLQSIIKANNLRPEKCLTSWHGNDKRCGSGWFFILLHYEIMCNLFVLLGRSYNNLMFMVPKVDASSCHGFQLMQNIIFLVKHFAMHFGGSLQCLHKNVVLVRSSFFVSTKKLQLLPN